MSAIATFTLLAGTVTVSCFAVRAFLILVSISAMGSVILSASLPASLSDSGDLALVGEIAEAYSAYAVLSQHRVRTSADAAAGILARREFLGSLLLYFH